MYLLVDVIVVALLIIGVWRGLKKGFFNTSYGLIGSLIVIALSAVLAVGFTFVFHKLGAIDQLKLAFMNVIGETNGLFRKMNITSEQVAYYISLAVIGLPCFVLAYVIMLWVHKSFCSLMEECRENIVFRVIDSTVGVVVNTALVVLLVFGTYAIINVFNAHNMLTSAGETLIACPISGFIYEHNPLNSVISDAGFIQSIVSALN